MPENKELSKFVQKQKDLIDDYLGSVMGLYAFAESACWDENTRQRISNSFYRIPHKLNNDEIELTPDSAIQVNNSYGIISEMKKHFNEDKDDQFKQIKKYDAELVGWWTENKKISNHDLVLLCHLFSSITAKDNYEKWLSSGNSFNRNFAIVEFSYSDSGQKQNFVLRRIEGKLSDQEHDESLRKTKIIPQRIVEKLLSKYKFYDGPPPLFHTLLLIYNCILPLLIKQEEFEEITGKQKRTVETTAEIIRDMMQEQFLPKDTSLKLPKLKWVTEALDFLVEIGIANLSGNKYKITLQAPHKKDLIEYFSSKLFSIQRERKMKSNKIDGQQELFFL